MKQVAILVLVAIMLNGCGTTSTPVQTAAGGTWEAQMLGGEGSSSGFSFTTQFTVGGAGALSISYFQFINQSQCFPFNGGAVAGTMDLIVNQTNFTVTGPFAFSVQSGGNTLTLTGNVTGTENGLNGGTLTGASVTGTWSLVGGTGCNDVTGGSFTMSQST
jgi:hypothetical protein